MQGETEGVDTDTVYDLLARDRRRLVLQHLRDVDDEPVHLDDLATAIATAEAESVAEADSTADAGSTADADRSAASETRSGTESAADDHVRAVRTSLYHAHLPKLADAGVVQFSPNPGRISLGEHASAVLSLLDDVTGTD